MPPVCNIEIVGFFLKKKILLNSDVLENLDENKIDSLINIISDKDLLTLTPEAIELLNLKKEINWQRRSKTNARR